MISSENVDFYIKQIDAAVEVDDLDHNERKGYKEIVLDNPYQQFSYVILRFNHNFRFIMSFTKVFYSGRTEHYICMR